MNFAQGTASASGTELKDRLLAASNPPEIVTARVAGIHETLRRRSRNVREGNFAAIGVDDLERLFKLYDEHFFEGLLQRLVTEQAERGLKFRLSKRMTSVGGVTARHQYTVRQHDRSWRETMYEIAISTTLLFQTFEDIDRPILVNGIECRDRLEALQRVFEHELVHLLEHLVWGDSSCKAANFKQLAGGHFGHKDVTHQLVTQHERALTQYQIRVGDRVAFDYEGTPHVGIVNRITRRATVLVERPDGVPYTDGKRYGKFYIPLGMLRKAES